MQTLEFTRGLKKIVDALKVNELIGLLQGWLEPGTQNISISDADKDKFSSLALGSYAGYSQLSATEATGRIISGLGVQQFYEPARMRRMIFIVSNSPQTQHLRNNLPEIYGFYESLKAFQRLAATCISLLEVEKVGAVEPSDAILELQLIDYDGKGIEPERIARVSGLVSRLFMNLARLLDVKDDRPTFSYFDSGSDVILGIKSAAEVVRGARAVFLQFWNKIMFRQQENFERDMDALSKGLDFLDKTQESVKKGAITPEEARNLKVRVFQEVDKLISLGATLPLREGTPIDQRQLLIEKRDVKLLASGEPEPPEDEHSGEPNSASQ